MPLFFFTAHMNNQRVHCKKTSPPRLTHKRSWVLVVATSLIILLAAPASSTFLSQLWQLSDKKILRDDMGLNNSKNFSSSFAQENHSALHGTEPTYVFSGRITSSADNTPLSEVQVRWIKSNPEDLEFQLYDARLLSPPNSLLPADYRKILSASLNTISGRDGSFSLELPGDGNEGCLVISKDSFETVIYSIHQDLTLNQRFQSHLHYKSLGHPVDPRRKVNKFASGESRSVDFALKPAGSLSGSILGADGSPASGMIVIASTSKRTGGLVRYFSEMALPGQRVLSDPVGNFMFKNIASGQYTISVLTGESRYVSTTSWESKNYVVKAGEHNSTAKLIVEPAGEIVGLIKNKDGQVLPNCNIFLGPLFELDPLNGRFPENSKWKSESRGMFRISGLPLSCTYSLTIRHPSYASKTMPDIKLGLAKPTIRFDFKLSKAGSISGTIQGSDGVTTSVSAVRIKSILGATQRMDSYYQRIQTSNGIFSFNNLEAGTYQITTDDQKGIIIELNTGEAITGIQLIKTPEKKIIRKAHTTNDFITGYVHDDLGNPIAGAQIIGSEGPGRKAIAHSDEQGCFSLPVIKGEYTLQATKSHGEFPSRSALRSNRVRVQSGQQAKLVIPRGAKISGKIIMPDGSAPKFFYTISCATKQLSHSPVWGINCYTREPLDQSGRYELNHVSPGNVQIVINMAGFAICRQNLFVESGSTTSNYDLQLQYGESITGEIFNGGLPVAKARISAKRISSLETDMFFESEISPIGQSELLAFSNSAGFFSLDSLESGVYELQIEHLNHASPNNFQVIVKESTKKQIERINLPAGIPMKFKVFDHGLPAAIIRVLFFREDFPEIILRTNSLGVAEGRSFQSGEWNYSVLGSLANPGANPKVGRVLVSGGGENRREIRIGEGFKISGEISNWEQSNKYSRANIILRREVNGVITNSAGDKLQETIPNSFHRSIVAYGTLDDDHRYKLVDVEPGIYLLQILSGLPWNGTRNQLQNFGLLYSAKIVMPEKNLEHNIQLEAAK